MAVVSRLLNYSEERTYGRLQSACTFWGARVFAKVRVADVLQIEDSALGYDHRRYALQAHFDFVVTDEQFMPQFGVEFDGPYHSGSRQAERDQLKDSLCSRSEFPLLRINDEYLKQKYRRKDILSWLVAVWFLETWFDEAQQNGSIPWDEPFDPLYLSIGNSEEVFPFWLSHDAIEDFRALHKAGRCMLPAPCLIVAREPNEGPLRAFACMPLSATTGVSAQTAMRHQLFPEHHLAQALEEIVVIELLLKLKSALRGTRSPEPLDTIWREHARFHETLELHHAMSCGPIVPPRREAG